jgi:tetratricopeptide (TPR) repeat protein
MAKIKKKTAKPQYQPGEELRSIAENVAGYYRAYQKPFNTTLTIIAVALIIWALYAFVNAGKEKKAGQLFEAAYSFYSAAGPQGPDYQRALQGFQEVVRQYGGTMSGAVAQYYVGNTLAMMGRPDDALREYELFKQNHGGRTLLLGMVNQRMGYVYAALGKREEAVLAYGKAESLLGAGPATLELARLYERMGNAEDASKKYKELSEKLPATTLALEARSKLPPPDIKVPAGVSGGGAGK